jgi:alpha-acetolactate decarboxylase
MIFHAKPTPLWLLLAASLAAGCAKPGTWDGQVRNWGTLREVLHEGHSEGRIDLQTATREPHVYGLGAMEALHGEVVILDSRAWVARGDAGGQTTSTHKAEPKDRATLLITAQVPRWTARTLERDVSPSDFDRVIREMADGAGLKEIPTVPFVIQGTLMDLQMHVVNGACPMNASEGGKDAPIRTALAEARGTLVGIHTNADPGVLTHHGSSTHVHALLNGPPIAAGHVDSVGVKAGAIVRFPEV